MRSISKRKGVFHSREYDTILDSMIKYFPLNEPFNLYDISQKANLSYEDFLTDGISKTKQTYIQITNLLIYNGFVELKDFENTILTDKGRQLVDYGNYKAYGDIIKRQLEAKKKDLWVKKNWYWIEFIKIILAALVGIFLTLFVEYFK